MITLDVSLLFPSDGQLTLLKTVKPRSTADQSKNQKHGLGLRLQTLEIDLPQRPRNMKLQIGCFDDPKDRWYNTDITPPDIRQPDTTWCPYP